MKKIIAVLFLCAVLSSPASGDTTENEFWDNGKVRVSSSYDSSGEMRERTYYDEDGCRELRETYNGIGEKTSEARYDKSGKLKTGPDGWACMMWKYNDGKMTGEGYYGADGKLIEYKRYNSEGDLVDKKYFGGRDPDPSEEYETIPTIAGESVEYYDEYGREEGSTSLTYDEPFFPYYFIYDD